MMRKQALSLFVVFIAVSAAAQSQPWSSGPNSSIYYNNGSVGIGSGAPQCKLDFGSSAANQKLIVGTYTSGNYWGGIGMDPATMGLRLAGDPFAATNKPPIEVRFYSPAASHAWTNRFYAAANGNVGIGTAAPQSKLDFASSAANQKLIIGTYTSGNYWGGIGMDPATMGLRLAGDPTASTNNPLIDVGFYSVDASHTWTSRFYAAANGNVGIGTTSPAATLDVSGNVHATGSISAASVIGAVYQDVAEWVPSSESMPPGTVVVIDGTTANGVTPSKRPYDTAVAGVLSAQPGILLGAASPSKAKVATTGRVIVHVDASKAPIHAGDLLVTSDKPGVAMRSEPVDVAGVKVHRPGTPSGKALEPLENGQGQILVLLSLQ